VTVADAIVDAGPDTVADGAGVVDISNNVDEKGVAGDATSDLPSLSIEHYTDLGLWRVLGEAFSSNSERMAALRTLQELRIGTIAQLSKWLARGEDCSSLSPDALHRLSNAIAPRNRVFHAHIFHACQRTQGKSMCSQLAIASAINALLFHGLNAPGKLETLPQEYLGVPMLASYGCAPAEDPLRMPGPLTGTDVRDSDWMKKTLRKKYKDPTHPVHGDGPEGYLTCVRTMVGNGDIVRAINEGPYSDRLVADMLVARCVGGLVRLSMSVIMVVLMVVMLMFVCLCYHHTHHTHHTHKKIKIRHIRHIIHFIHINT
jgi:hypothetical protein